MGAEHHISLVARLPTAANFASPKMKQNSKKINLNEMHMRGNLLGGNDYLIKDF
jgi:hypothetical protein